MHASPEIAALYKRRRWGALRTQQLARQPLCQFCLQRGLVMPANVADHIVPHRGDPALFWSLSNLQSLCERCHNAVKTRQDRGGRGRVAYDANGNPQGTHHWNAGLGDIFSAASPARTDLGHLHT